MAQVHLLFANKSYDTAKQVVEKNQIIQMNGYEDDRYVVYSITEGQSGLIYNLINLRTHKFGQCDLIRPLSEKFGIGYYYDDENPRFMDAFEVAVLQSEAEQKRQAGQETKRQEQERNEQLKIIGRERLNAIVPANTQAVIIARLHKDESDILSDYHGYTTTRTVILGFSSHTRNDFREMRSFAGNFEGTSYLAEKNADYEHREDYTGGSGYYLGRSKYNGWCIKKDIFGDITKLINAYALIAGDEENICIPQVQTDTNIATEAVTGDFTIVDYSEKALAIFGNTRSIKDQLKAIGGRFNPKLTRNGEKVAGWIFSKSKEKQLRDLLTAK